jgi:ABC-type antimicrobial peptide transport system permease subunit
VVGDIHQRALDIAARPEYFVSHSQLPQALFFAPPQDLAIRAHSDPAALTTAVREAIWAVDSQQPVAQVKVLADYLEEDLAPRRFQMQLLAGFAGLALLLASLGIYGVLSYSVAQRRREIGVRMALGAQASDLVRLVVSQGIGPAAGGLALGLIAAYALAHLISGLLYEVSAHDPLTFGAAAAALLAIALLACWIPARRASKVDPLQALRFE